MKSALAITVINGTTGSLFQWICDLWITTSLMRGILQISPASGIGEAEERHWYIPSVLYILYCSYVLLYELQKELLLPLSGWNIPRVAISHLWHVHCPRGVHRLLNPSIKPAVNEESIGPRWRAPYDAVSGDRSTYRRNCESSATSKYTHSSVVCRCKGRSSWAGPHWKLHGSQESPIGLDLCCTKRIKDSRGLL